ncbi:MAG: hypothetical protein Q7U76_13115 [Nitrospirota bacterium]|nr:hypothetical protein [Nitrospirota bacterium]
MDNVSSFTARASRNKSFSFFLLEPGGRPHPFVVVRNGEAIACTGELELFVNPQELSKECPSRSTVTQTPHAAWVDSFGAGLPRWTLSGITGWRARAASQGVLSADSRMDGYSAFHVFSQMIQEYLDENRERVIQVSRTGAPTGMLSLVFYDHADDDAWIIEPEGLPTKRRTKDRPLYYEYSFRFTGIHDLHKKNRQVDDPLASAVIGGIDRNKAIAAAMTTYANALETLTNDYLMTAANDQASAESVDAMTQNVSDMVDMQTPESVNARTQLFSVVDDANSQMGDLPQGSLTAAQQAAVDNATVAGADLQQAIASGTAAQVETAHGEWATCMESVRDSGAMLPGDVTQRLAQASVFSKVKDGAAELLQGVKSTATRLGSIVQTGQALAGDFMNMVSGVQKAIITPIEKAVAYAQDIRKTLQGFAWTLSLVKLTANVQSQLRGLRTQLRGMLCAVQSLLAFPHNFVQSLRDSLQSFFDLFKLSGCASTFPRIKGVSWHPSAPLTVPGL